MVNRKRGRRAEQDSDESADEARDAAEANTSQAHGSKRSRRSHEQDASAANDDDDEMQDSDDLDCTQPELATNKSAAEVGIIEKITLINFMCHTMLEVPLGSNVNFIIGRNGSGKSAIMTALVVGLGGKATTTNRGSSLKGFIKNGCSYGQTSIKLRNRGLDAYCPDQYGQSITVERRISSDGSGSYKLKSHTGRTISTKKDELNHILDQFNIQVDNPISVLNQDTSRNFLNSSDPKDKYKFFLKATQLEQISNDYQMVLEHQDVIKNLLEHKSQMIPDIKKEVDALGNKYNDIKQLRNMKEQVEELKNERVWAEVIENEKKLGPLEKDVEKTQGKLPRYVKKIEDCKQEIQVLEDESKTVQEQIDVVVQEAKEVTAQQTEINTELKRLKTDLRKKESEVRKVKSNLHSSRQDTKQLMDRIDEIKQTALHDREAERQQRENALTEKRDALQSCQNQLTTTSHHRDQVSQAINRAKENSYSLKIEVSDAKRAVENIQRNLQNLRNSTRDRLSLYGAYMPDLIQRIQGAARRARFHRTPVGPLGAHLKLRDQKWALGVESHIKGLVYAFCCHDGHDQQILQQLMRQVCPKDNMPQIIISKFQDSVHDVSRNKPRCKYSTVQDELVIDNIVAANCLIDQAGIESVLMIEDPKEARQVMFGTPPHGAVMAYAINGDQLIGGRSAKYYSSFNNSAKFLQQDIEQEIRRLERDLNTKQQQHQELQDRLQQLDASIAENKRELQKANGKAMREQEMVNRLVEEITELENYEEEELPDVTTLEEEVVNYNQQILELEQQETVLDDEYEKVKEAHHKQDLKMQRHKETMQVVFEKHDPLKARQEAIMIKILTLKNNKKHYQDGMKGIEEAIRKAEKAVTDMKVMIEDVSEMAAQYCERIDTQKTVKALESEIVQKEKCIRTEEKNHGKHEQITKQYFDAKLKYENITESMQNLKTFHKRLKKMMTKRTQAYVDYRSFIAIRAVFFFQMMLSQRGYTGKMKFDHAKESLVLEVNVEQGSKKAAKDTRSLSGGERSFSTVSFIMALWEAMESPFRCLDEFDVFMDMVNRRISMQMMLKVAKEQEQRQFILLTPQDMSAIGGGPNVRIFRMQDPERGQTILDFQPDEQPGGSNS